MKRFFLLLAILFLPVLAVAQNTTVTATVTDPNTVPYAFGTGYASLVCPGNQAPTYNGFSVPRTFTVGTFNGNGTFTQVVYDVSVLVPVGCGYQWHITAQNGTTSFITTIITSVTGAAVNESAAISASAATLPGSGPSGVPGGPFNSVQFNAAGVFGGNSGFTYVPGTPQVDINNASTTSPQGQFSVRGIGTGSLGGGTIMQSISTENDNPYHLALFNKAAPAGAYMGAFFTSTATFNINLTDGGVQFGSLQIAPTPDGNGLIGSGVADMFSYIGESDGTHPANYSFGGNTTPFPITPNTFNLMGPPVASFTAYALQMPSVGPTTANSLLSCITPVGSVSACSFVATPVTGCTTSGGVAFQNGTNNQLTCSAQLRVNSSNGETFVTSTNISGTGFLVSNTGAAGPGTGGGSGILGFIQETITGSSPFIPVGVTASVTTQGTGGLTVGMVGNESAGQNGASGTVVSAKAYEAGAFSNTGGGSITNAYGFYADQQTAGTNNFGFFSQPGNTDVMANLSVTSLKASALLLNTTAPTIAAAGCGGAAATISASNGTAAFRVGIGTSNTGTCTITMPTAAVGWNCQATNLTTKNTNQATVLETSASGATTLVLQNYSDVMGTHAMTDADVLSVTCTGD